MVSMSVLTLPALGYFQHLVTGGGGGGLGGPPPSLSNKLVESNDERENLHVCRSFT